MNKMDSPASVFELWLLTGKAQHSIMLVRQREIRKYPIPIHHSHILYTIQALGSKATLFEVAKEVERAVHVISRQAVILEGEGLIKRIRISPSSKLLRLELTKKGFDVIKVAKDSKSIATIFSCLSKEEREQLESISKKLLIQSKNYTSLEF